MLCNGSLLKLIAINCLTATVLLACSHGSGVMMLSNRENISQKANYIGDGFLELSIINNNEFDICVPDYLWPYPNIISDTFKIINNAGEEVEYIGIESTVVGDKKHTVRAGGAETIRVDLSGSYRLSGLGGAYSVEYVAPWARNCHE